jgi:hypothetical protein
MTRSSLESISLDGLNTVIGGADLTNCGGDPRKFTPMAPNARGGNVASVGGDVFGICPDNDLANGTFNIPNGRVEEAKRSGLHTLDAFGK